MDIHKEVNASLNNDVKMIILALYESKYLQCVNIEIDNTLNKCKNCVVFQCIFNDFVDIFKICFTYLGQYKCFIYRIITLNVNTKDSFQENIGICYKKYAMINIIEHNLHNYLINIDKLQINKSWICTMTKENNIVGVPLDMVILGNTVNTFESFLCKIKYRLKKEVGDLITRYYKKKTT
jgi:hypothetical protein